MTLRSIALPTLILCSSIAPAQPPNDDCTDSALLCDDQPIGGNNTGATGWPGFCPGTDNVLWYSFTTNSVVGGTVDISLVNINCLTVAGMDNELSVTVLSGDGSCTPGTFNSAGPCAQDSLDFTVTSNVLQPNTQYWVIVAGVADNGATMAAECDFNISISGPAADIVGVDFYASDDVEIGEGETTHLLATGSDNWNWTPTAGLVGGNTTADPFATPSETTTYTVTTTINGCVYSDEVLVEVIRRIIPPNTFTPNGDGINDTWHIDRIKDYPNAEVSIYDRWGQRVFHSSGYKEEWDGEGLPVGTYYYVIDLRQLEGQSPAYTGYVAIVR